MKIALIQSDLVWENPFANRELFEKQINAVEDADLIVLPEMFSTAFSMRPKPIAETMDGETVRWMMAIARRKSIAITGSLIVSDGSNFYNRLLFVFPDGTVQTYDKRHLFSLAGEDKIYTAGKKRLVVDYKGFKICPLVCYDLRFPVFSRNTEDFDVLIYVSNWPEPRIHAWDSLLKARAIENMCYVIGLNRIGNDDNGNNYPGHSQAIDFLGNMVLEPKTQQGSFVVELDKSKMLKARNTFRFLNDRDAFTLG